jgi:uncharacterized BrkB/YihY/UPF0761 family membrane protein
VTNQSVSAVRRVVWDVVLTIILLVATMGILLFSAFFDLFAVAFTDYCPAPCHAGTGIAVVFTAWICTAVVAVLGTVLSIVRLTRRRRAWWFALGTMVLVIIGSAAAFWLYTTIVGY